MNKLIADSHVLPRPVERLPDYAHAKARQALAERLSSAFRLSPEVSAAVSNAVVDPSSLRKSIGDPTDPEIERIAVPGGTLLGLRTQMWAHRVMPDPRNPRTLPARRHPFAIDPGAGAEDSKFRPVPEPRAAREDDPACAELVVEVDSRDHLTWASQHAASYILAENDWRESVASQGVMEAVWVVATSYQHGDGSAPAIALVSAEGSSRMTAVHEKLSIRSSDVPYDESDARLRGYLRKLNESFDIGPSDQDLIALRCARVPALVLVGFRSHPGGTTGFPTAVKSLVALRHVDPPTPWGEGPQNESLADEVLDELYRRDLIPKAKRDYFAGLCTRAQAKAAHLSDNPAVRAAEIVRLFTSPDERVQQAIRAAVTSQSTRTRITTNLANELATALIMRSVRDERSKVDQVRRYMRHAFGKAVHRALWSSTDRSTTELVKEALSEVRRSIAGEEPVDGPGPASLELAVRSAYPLIVSGRLNADRGTAGNSQPDRRNPGEVLDTMRRSVQGVLQLGQALSDFADDQAIRAVDEDAKIRKLDDGIDDLMVNDIYLRSEFPPPGRARAPRSGDTAADRYYNRVSTMSRVFDELQEAFRQLAAVTGDNGRPLVEVRGVDSRSCTAWRDLLGQIDEELVIWGRTFRQTYGIRAMAADVTVAPLGDSGASEADPVDSWDRSTGVDDSEAVAS
jgi:hypothetical protein